MYPTCTFDVPCLDITCILLVQNMYSLCTLLELCMYSTCSCIVPDLNFTCSQAELLIKRLEVQTTPDGAGEVAFFGGIRIGHARFKGSQLVYTVPFPKKLFRGECNRQDFVFVRPPGNDPEQFHPDPDNVWYGQCLLSFSVIVQGDKPEDRFMCKLVLFSKLEPFNHEVPRPEQDWMDMIESRMLYELDPRLPRLFVLPISSVLGKVPLVRAGHTGTIPYSMRGEAKERRYYPGAKCDTKEGAGDGCRVWFVNMYAMKWAERT